MLETLNELLESMAKDDLIFSNEQQFQFELSNRLKNKGFKVYLEVASYKTDSGKNPINEIKSCKTKTARKNIKFNKEYTDIIVKNNEGECFAIELKYKTDDQVCVYNSKKQSEDIITLAQGAKDFNAYDFIYDIYRLENVKNRYFSNSIQNNITKCYAILLTNSSDKYRFNGFKGIWTNYSLKEGRQLKGTLKICDKSGVDTNEPYKYNLNKIKKNGDPNPSIKNPISLNGIYKLEKAKSKKDGGWHNYEPDGYPLSNGNPGFPGFSYLILEIDPNL